MSVTHLPLTVVLYDGPIGRAYLARLRQAGFLPERILLLILDQHPATKKPYPRWLPFRQAYAEKMQNLALNHWPRMLPIQHAELYQSVVQTMETFYGDAEKNLSEIQGKMNWANYALHVGRVVVTGLKDSRLESALRALPQKTLLYTGGGIIPKNLFTIDDLCWLHVHPGHLPYIRGADGVLWGITQRGCPGAGLFYMEPGLDTGPVIRSGDLPHLQFKLPGARPDDQTLYRFLFSYYDPILRADFLVQTLKQLPHLRMHELPARVQDHAQSTTYRFMDEAQRKTALTLLFN